MKSHKKLLFKFAYISVLIIILIVSFNLIVDSFNIFGKNKNNSIIDELKNGKYITSELIATNRINNIYDKLLFLYKNNNLDALAIGSSRAISLHKELIFNNQKVQYLNFTTGTARLNHLAKMIGLFKKHSMELPSRIIIGLDPYIFDNQISLSTIKSLINNQTSQINNDYSQLFNYEYTKINLQSIFTENSYISSANLQDARAQNENFMTLSPNGDLYYPESQENLDLESIQNSITKFIDGCEANKFDIRCMNMKNLNNLEEFSYLVNYLKKNGSKVIIFLSPIAPTFYSYLLKKTNFKEHHEHIKNILKNLQLDFIGDYNPYIYNLKDKNFIDSLHPKTEVIKQIFKTQKVDLM